MPDAEEVLDRAVTLAQRYGEAIVEIHNALNDETYSDAGKVMRARSVLAGLDLEAQLTYDEAERAVEKFGASLAGRPLGEQYTLVNALNGRLLALDGFDAAILHESVSQMAGEPDAD